MTETARHADVVLPTLCYVEKEGSFINLEGSIQKLNPGKDLPEGPRADGTIFEQISDKLGIPISIDISFTKKLEEKRIQLQTKPTKNTPAQPPAVSGTLRATFAPQLFDRGVRMKHNVHLSQNAKEPRIQMHKETAEKFKFENGERIQVTANGLTMSGRMKVNDGIARDTIVIPLGFQAIPAHELGIQLFNGIPVEVAKEE